MDRDIFISYIEEDGAVARALASELRVSGHTTWTYEEDGVAGISYLTQVHRAIEGCRAFVLLASHKSVKATQVIREVEQAHEREKIIVAVRLALTHQQFVASNPILRMATGTAVTLAAEAGHLTEVAQRISSTLRIVASDSSSPATIPSARSTQPVEPSTHLAGSTTPAAPVQSRHESVAARSNIESSSEVTASTTLNVPSKPSHPRTSVWVGIGILIAWGALMTIGWVTDPPADGFTLKSLGLTAAIGILVTAILMARYGARLKQSSDAESVTYVVSMRRLLIATLICVVTMSASMWPGVTFDATSWGEMFGLLLVPILPCVVSVALVWNGLRKLRKTGDAATG